MNVIWQKRVLRVLANFGISFITPFTGSGIAQEIYTDQIIFEQMVAVGVISSLAYTGLVALQEIREFASK
jgi:hypothetical protein